MLNTFECGSKSINHVFVVCAYKKSPYLERCIKSLLNQTVCSNIIIATSTENSHISYISTKYKIPLFVNKSEASGGLKNDWNFAYDKADKDFVTLVHQDDVFDNKYAESVLQRIYSKEDILLIHTDYFNILNDEMYRRSTCNVIHKFINYPFKYQIFESNKLIRKLMFCFGNSVKCPTVTYNKRLLGDSIFDSELRFALDWDTFAKIAGRSGRFVYIAEPLLHYNIHKEAETKKYIDSGKRAQEDFAMFKKFWAEPIAWLLLKIYKLSYKVYD